MLRDRDGYLSVPSSIELLFENEKLELMKVLCLISSMSSKRRKYLSVSEIVFYYAIVNFNLITIFEDVNITSSPNQFFRFQSRISNIIIRMENLNFIELKATLSTKKDDIKIRISSSGMKFYEEHNSVFFRSCKKGTYQVSRGLIILLKI